ncbi:restriction endonuclease [Bosea sp. (in: a-proteobacteria)]|uniref:restriction endonuclease n=1 Tax=Bosea sp. (in: a-proteobacteria) TaxID=1871050 RepID=UPI001AC899BA|nr:restriction endonuclease [Bosea sp. (in: a-proteobacteria)]MBN9436952.1 restriction endonuclease [Bosea sp. (in: a-proteobacteria)]
MDEQTTYEVGTEYEQFTQAVYQALVDADGVENIEVKHNIKLLGKSGCEHQIDVYWEFKIAGQTYRTAIECKAFNKNVSIGRVRDFYGVVLDVPGLNGIFVTLVGFQSGARKYADHYGITLKELRKPTEGDWDGRVKTVVLKFHIVTPKISKFEPVLNPSYLANLNPDVRVEIGGGFQSDEKIILDEHGEAVMSYDDIRDAIPMTTENEAGLRFSISLPNHSIQLGGSTYPIDGINVLYDMEVETEERRIDGESLVQAIVKDAKSGELKVVMHSGDVRTARSDP